MTKQDFIALADSIRYANTHEKSHAFSKGQIELLANFCQSSNPRFNRARWLGYVNGENGPNGGAIKPAKCCAGVGFHSSNCVEVR